MLTGPQYQQLTSALTHAFPTANALSLMVRFKFGENLAEFVNLADPLSVIAFNLIQEMEARGWTHRLIAAARESKPDNPEIFAVAQQFGLAVQFPPGAPRLEQIVRDTHSFLDIVRFRVRLAQIETQVCRVELDTDTGRSYGTGFLVAPDVVMTNHHVVQPLIERRNPLASGSIRLRFDYKRAPDGEELNPGQVFHLADEWLIDSSPPSPVDFEPEPKGSLPDPQHLDYALLRVADAVGNNPVGARPEPGAAPRGWLTFSAQADFPPDSPLFIVQHPAGEPMQLALDLQAVIKVNGNRTRVQYRTNTLPGSSGSPCFNKNWELVALHHSGDPEYSSLHHASYNEGIPVSAIASLLAARKLQDVLG
jgi:hypothetical protein